MFMQKAVNLLSLTSLFKTEFLEDYCNYCGFTLKTREPKCIGQLVELLRANDADTADFNDFYVSYHIPQISREFDLLRIGEDHILDIELKDEHTNSIEKQLKQNRYYLSHFDKPIYSFTYVRDGDKLYSLNEKNELIEAQISDLVKIITLESNHYTGNLDEKFNPSDYLVSPFNSTIKFISGEYFLSDSQEEIVRQTKLLFSTNGMQIASIEGAAGTGKTLLAYHIAKQMIDRGQKPLIIHTANLNSGQNDLINTYSWSIVPIKSAIYHLDNHATNENGKAVYDCIIIDETQRMDVDQFNKIMHFVKAHQLKCIICFDRSQVLKQKEKLSDLTPAIDRSSIKKFKLKCKIRTNENVAEFIYSMFNLRLKKKFSVEDVHIVHFADYNSAGEYISSLKNFRYVSPTPSQYYDNEVDELRSVENHFGSVHDAIGQEFDNVVAVIDEIFFYKDGCYLTSNGRRGVPYLQPEMLIQAVSRTRRKLEIVVINNLPVFKELIGILEYAESKNSVPPSTPNSKSAA
jgi:hypothetical protein